MAKREIEVEQGGDEKDVTKLSKLLIKEFNKDEEKTGKLAWSLAFDDDNPTEVRGFISTGNTLLNYIIANKPNGGIPVGKLTEIVGEEASGKSLLCMHLAAEVQKKGGLVIYIDTENALMPEFATAIGVDLTKLVYAQPETVEDVGVFIEKTIVLARQKAPTKLVLIIWDSVAGTPTKMELEGEFDLNMNQSLQKSKVLYQMMRKITQSIGKQQVAVVVTNQLKTKIGVMYGDPMTTSGGKAIPYHASVRIRVNRAGTEKDGDAAITGVNTNAKVIKNRLGPPLRKCSFFISFDHGIENEESWFNYLHEKGAIEKKDGWCYLNDIPSGKIEEKGVDAGKDKGLKFREKGFTELLRTDPRAKKWAEDKLEELMVVKYGDKPADMEADPESLLEVEQTVTDIVEPS